MSISVRPARLESDERDIVNFLNSNLPYRSHSRYFPWLYRKNPDGEALAWVAVDEQTGGLAGVAAAFPRTISFGGATGRGYLLGDFCTDPANRSLGLALSLQRACLEGVAAAQGDFAIDLPSRSMMAVYNRLGISANETIIRHVKPLRADLQIDKRVPVRAVASGLSAMANSFLRLRDHASATNGEWTISREEDPWLDEFTEFARNSTPAKTITMARTGRYLTWRYREHPDRSYEMLSARLHGRLVGYLIRHTQESTCIIDDLLTDDALACRALLKEVVIRARREGAYRISAPWPSADADAVKLREWGFRSREATPAVVLPLARAASTESGLKSAPWHISHGDWET